MAIKFLNNIKDSYNEVFNFDQNDFRIQGKHINAEFGVWARSYGSIRQMGLDGGASFMGLFTSGTEKVRITSDGNVGIGTTSPGHKLQVAGNIYANAGQIYIDNGYYLSGGDASSRIYLGNDGGDGVQIYTDSTERMRIDDGGNVGIGTSSPSQKLEVSGTILQSVLNGSPNDDTNDVVGTRYFKTHTATTNAPVSTFGMGINIEYGSGNSMQLMSSRSSGHALYMRKQSNSTWSSWIRIRDENQITDSDISNWDDGYSKWSGTSGSNDWDNIDENSFIKGHTTTLNYPPDLSQSFLSGIAAMYSSGNGWQLASTRGSTANLYHRHVTNDTWHSWKRILDSDDIYVDSSNGNIGIGTTSPAVDLHVADDVRIDDDLFVRTISSQYFSSSNNLSLIYGDAANFTVSSNATERFRITSSGNVGIGTTSPSSKLHIVDGNNYVKIGDINGISTAVIELNDGNPVQVEGYNSDLTFRTNGSRRMTITNGGSVGIGTTSPSYTLDVTGDIRVTDDMFVNDDLTVGSAGNGQILVGSIGYLSGASTSIFDIYTPGNLRFNADSNDNGNGYISFEESGDEKMRITHTGRLGIGTTSPSEKLHIAQSSDSSGFKISGYDDNSSENYRIYVSSDGSSNIRTTSYIRTVADSYYYDLNSGGAFRVRNDSTSVLLQVNNSGKVGIGTTSPTYKLDVETSDDIVASFVSTDNKASIRINDNDTSVYVSAENSKASFGFNAGVNAGNLNVDTLGYVGIGTSSPAAKLQVDGHGSLDGEIRINASGDNTEFGLLRFVGDSATYEKYLIAYNSAHVSQADEISLKNAGGDVTIYTGTSGTSSEKVRIDTSGNVGIGESQPSYKLHVAGTFRASGNSSIGGNVGIGTSSPAAKLHTKGSGIVNIVESSNTVSYTQYYNTSTGTTTTNDGLTVGINGLDAYVYQREAANLILGTSDTERLRITSDGKVGIGTTSPSTKLHITDSSSPYLLTLQSDTTTKWKLGVGNSGYYQGWFILNNSADGDVLRFSTAALNVLKNVRVDFSDNSTTLSTGGSGLRLANTNTTVNNISAIDFPQSSGGSGFSRIGVIYKDRTASSEDQDMFFRTIGGGSSAEVMRLTSEGKVGIGTTSPSEKLDVNGNIQASTYKISGVTVLQGSSTVTVGSGGGTGQVRLNTTSGVGLTLNGSNVGIGTTSPSEKLEVDGNVKADSFIGGNEAGIYTFSDTVNADSSEDIFSVSCSNGAAAFRVTFVCSTSGMSVAKTYEVVKAYGADPVFFKVVDTGAYSGHDFDVSFTNSNSDTGVTCEITNNSASINANIVTTVFLGGSPTTITVTAL